MSNYEVANPKQFIDSTNKILSLISALFSIISFVISFKYMKWWLYVITATIFIISIILIVKRKSIGKKLMIVFLNKTAPDKNYKLIEKKSTYTFKSYTEMEFYSSCKVKALHDGLEYIVVRYRWTGPHNPVVKTLNGQHNITEIESRMSGYQCCKIDFRGKKYNKNDRTIDTGFKMEKLTDSNRVSSPHLCTGVYDITDKLVLEVKFSKELKVKDIRKLEFIHYTDDEHYKCVNEDVPTIEGDWQVIRYEIEHPIYGGKYLIDWVFDN